MCLMVIEPVLFLCLPDTTTVPDTVTQQSRCTQLRYSICGPRKLFLLCQFQNLAYCTIRHLALLL